MNNWNKLATAVTYISQIVFYPVHLVLRLVARLVLLVGIVASVPILPILFICGLRSWGPDILQLLPSDHDKKAEIAAIIALVASLGGLTFLLKKSSEVIRESLIALKNSVTGVVCTGWIPGIEIGRSLLETWQDNIARILPTIWKMFKTSGSLVVALLMLLIIPISAYVPIDSLAKWQSDVTKKLEDIEKRQLAQTGNFVVLGAERLSYVFEKGTVFSLVYPNANLKENKGICPEGANLEWLQMFKAALTECPSEPPLELEVRAFSSIAPVAVEGRYDHSDPLNCEIANRRAEAVVGLLTLKEDIGSDTCETVLNDSKWQRVEGQLCKRDKPNFNFGSQDGMNFSLIYRPWQSHGTMIDARLVDDGAVGGERRHKAEFFNRVVQIIVKNDSCWRGKTEALDGAP